MRYPYAVKVNGKWYAPGAEIPENQESTAKDTVPEMAKPVKTVENAVETVETLTEEAKDSSEKATNEAEKPVKKAKKS